MISTEGVWYMMHEELGYGKVSAKWVPENKLSNKNEQKRVQALFSFENLELMRGDNNFFSRVVTGDETWVHHWDPETKQESMQRSHKDSSPTKTFKTQPSAGK